MNYLSVCSGIEAATVAWKPLGWNPVAFSEIEAFPSAVLDYHYPNTPNLGDMERFHEWPESNVDVLVGGTPCQSFSVAGLRRGLDDPRGNLALVYLAIAERYRPEWLVWENVPGVLSANGGRAFGAFLGGLEKLGYGWAYRTLDAQYFGLAQRRRRVFVVASARGWGAAGSVLFEPESLRGDSPPGREAGERVADSLTVGANQYSGFCGEPVAHGLIPDIASTVTAGVPNGGAGHGARSGHAKDSTLIPTTAQCLNAGAMGRQYAESETLIPFDTSQITSKINRSNPQAGDPSHPLTASGDAPSIAHAFDARQNEVCQYGDMTGPLDTDGSSIGLQSGMSVRRLTPRECERLQGFPDLEDHLDIWVSETHQEHERLQSVAHAARSLNTGHTDQGPPVLVNVLIDLERRQVEIRNQEKLLLFASGAGEKDESRLHTLIVDSALALAGCLTTQESVILDGSEALRVSTIVSTRHLNGRMPAVVYGPEIEESASYAENAQKEAMKYTTSRRIHNPENCDWWFQTLSSCVAHAICGSIPEKTRTESCYGIRLICRHGYTFIPYRNGWAKDGPRYKALGNSMAVPVVRWIGERIQAVQEA